MKKPIIILSFIIYGCSSNITTNNEKCEDIKTVKIFQTLEDGALANKCEFNWDLLTTECSSFNQVVFISNQNGIEYYDGKKIKISNGKCIVQDGVYKYINKNEIIRTVPKLKVVNTRNLF